MSSYLALILMAAPGFIAKETSKWLGNEDKNISNFNEVLSYCVYSIFAIFLWMIISLLFGYLSCADLLIDRINQVYTIKDIFFMSFSLILSGFAAGLIWQAAIKRIYIKMMHCLSGGEEGTEYNIGTSCLKMMLSDGKNHLIKIKKDNQDIAVGQYLGMDTNSNSIIIQYDPFLQEWMENTSYKNKFILDKSIIDFDRNILIEEYKVPDNYWDSGK